MKRNKGFASVIIIIAILFVTIVGFIVLRKESSPEEDSHSNSSVIEVNEDGNFNQGVSRESGVPSGLSLPFNIEDIINDKAIVNPKGVVRGSKDLEGIGHGGIDIPLLQGSEIKAVADGKIVLVQSSSDPWGGKDVFQILEETGDGEGWGFLYEHVIPRVKVGHEVKRGDTVATKAAPERFTMHFQMSQLFNNFKYTMTNTCWPDLLDNSDKDKLMGWWAEYRQSKTLLEGWESVMEEGKYPFRGLLDKSKYPDGPQFCYKDGTDVR